MIDNLFEVSDRYFEKMGKKMTNEELRKDHEAIERSISSDEECYGEMYLERHSQNAFLYEFKLLLLEFGEKIKEMKDLINDK